MPDRTTVQIRTSRETKARLAKLAKMCGLSISEYMCQAGLNSTALNPEQSLKMKLLPKLCEHADLCELVKDPSVHAKLKNWRREIWQLLK